MFVLEQIIRDISVAYTALTDLDVVVELGNLDKAKNAETPRIVWTLTGGQFGTSQLIGGTHAVMAQALASYWVWFWFDDLETCWNAMSNMLAAIRRTVYGPNLGLLKFDCPTEVEGRHMDKGAVIVLTVTLSVPLPVDGTFPSPEVELTSHQSTVTEDSGIPDQDSGAFTPFETQLVTGPPT